MSNLTFRDGLHNVKLAWTEVFRQAKANKKEVIFFSIYLTAFGGMMLWVLFNISSPLMQNGQSVQNNITGGLALFGVIGIWDLFIATSLRKSYNFVYRKLSKQNVASQA